MEATLVVGVVIKPHGIRGEVVVEPRTDHPHRFEPGNELLAGKRALVVISSRPQGDRELVRFDGIEDRTAAETLRGMELIAPAIQTPELPEGSYWAHELVGFKVTTASGRSLGELRDVLDNPAHDLWVVRDAAGAETLIPAVRELVVSVDRSASSITVQDLPGLTEPG